MDPSHFRFFELLSAFVHFLLNPPLFVPRLGILQFVLHLEFVRGLGRKVPPTFKVNPVFVKLMYLLNTSTSIAQIGWFEVILATVVFLIALLFIIWLTLLQVGSETTVETEVAQKHRSKGVVKMVILVQEPIHQRRTTCWDPIVKGHYGTIIGLAFGVIHQRIVSGLDRQEKLKTEQIVITEQKSREEPLRKRDNKKHTQREETARNKDCFIR